MATEESLLQTGVDRFRSVVSTLDDEFQRVQKRLTTRRKSLERQIETRRKSIEREFDARRRTVEKEARKRLETLRKYPLVQRVEALRESAGETLETSVSTVLGTFQIASKGDLERIDRKLGQLGKKLKEIERSRSNGSGSV